MDIILTKNSYFPIFATLPGSVQTLRGSPESSPAGRPYPGAEAPTGIQQQFQEKELAEVPSSSSLLLFS